MTSYANLLIAVFLALLAACASACTDIGSRDKEMYEERQIDEFDGVKVSGGIRVTVYFDPVTRVEINTSSANPGRIYTRVRDGVLQIGQKSTFFASRSARVDVYTPEINFLVASGGSEIRMDETISGKSVELKASGGSNMHAGVNTDFLRVRASGGAEMRLAGFASELSARASSGSRISGYDLETALAGVEASSGADVRITVSDELNARASSGGGIRYRGSPKVVNSKASSGGSVSPSR